MNLIQSFIIALAMYSKIPVPRVDWNKQNMRYAMCFFPVVGMIIGACVYALGLGLAQCQVSGLFRGVAFTMLPLLISGGIHMDGYMDTLDALASYGDQEKKLAILKDSHSGAFAIMGLGAYLIISVAIWSEMPEKCIPMAAFVYVISRILSGFSVVTFPAARNSGLLKSFQDGAQKKTVRTVMIFYIGAVAGLFCNFDLKIHIGVFVTAFLVFFYYERLCKKQFGGVTGDLAGYFLQVSELLMLLVIMILGGGLWS